MPVFGDGLQTRAFSHIVDVAPVIAAPRSCRHRRTRSSTSAPTRRTRSSSSRRRSPGRFDVEASIEHLDRPQRGRARILRPRQGARGLRAPRAARPARPGSSAWRAWVREHGTRDPIELHGRDRGRSPAPAVLARRDRPLSLGPSARGAARLIVSRSVIRSSTAPGGHAQPRALARRAPTLDAGAERHECARRQEAVEDRQRLDEERARGMAPAQDAVAAQDEPAREPAVVALERRVHAGGAATEVHAARLGCRRRQPSGRTQAQREVEILAVHEEVPDRSRRRPPTPTAGRPPRRRSAPPGARGYAPASGDADD